MPEERRRRNSGTIAKICGGKETPEWNEEEFREGMLKENRRAREAAGADGFHGKEVSALPTGIIDVFYEITAQWREQEEVPKTMKIIRQASLPKPGKKVEVGNLRPIAVLSAWWRMFEGSHLQTKSFGKWRKNIGVKRVAYRESAEQVAAGAARDFEELGFMGAMDFSKAYDKMDPAISGAAMIGTGIPKKLVGTLLKV